MKLAPLAAGLLIFCAVSAAAQPFDYAIAGATENGCRVSAIIDPSHRLQWIAGGSRATGGTLANAVAPAAGGRVIAAIPAGDAFHVDFVTPSGSSQRIGSAPAGYTPLSLVASATGTVYVLARETASEQRVIVTIGSNGGVTVAPLPIADAVDIDLAADQCTLFVAANSRVARYNACTGTLLPDFAAGTAIRSVRILPDGGAVVARGAQAPLRFSAAGVPTQIYSFPLTEVTAIAVAEGGTRVVAATRCTEEIYSIDLATAAVTRVGFDLYDLELPRSIVPAMAWTAALGASHTANVPTLSEIALWLLACFLACVACLRMR